MRLKFYFLSHTGMHHTVCSVLKTYSIAPSQDQYGMQKTTRCPQTCIKTSITRCLWIFRLSFVKTNNLPGQLAASQSQSLDMKLKNHHRSVPPSVEHQWKEKAWPTAHCQKWPWENSHSPLLFHIYLLHCIAFPLLPFHTSCSESPIYNYSHQGQLYHLCSHLICHLNIEHSVTAPAWTNWSQSRCRRRW